MLPSLGALTPLSGVKFSSAALPKYRELLRSTRRRGSEEDSGRCVAAAPAAVAAGPVPASLCCVQFCCPMCCLTAYTPFCPCSLFQQAKERVLVRLQERRQRARHDPRRAFSRLQVCAVVDCCGLLHSFSCV